MLKAECEKLSNAPGERPENRPLPIHSSDLIRLLDHCDAAMTAAAHQMWPVNQDLAIALNKRAVECRIAIIDIQSNTKVSHGRSPLAGP